MSKIEIQLIGEKQVVAAAAIQDIRAAQARIKEIDDLISEVAKDLMDERKKLVQDVASKEVTLLQLAELGADRGTFYVKDPDYKVTIPATYSVDAKKIAAALASLPPALGDTVLVPKREFSKAGFDLALKIEPNLDTWFSDWVDVKLGKAKVEFG